MPTIAGGPKTVTLAAVVIFTGVYAGLFWIAL